MARLFYNTEITSQSLYYIELYSKIEIMHFNVHVDLYLLKTCFSFSYHNKIVLLQRNVAICISIRCCRLYPVSGFEFGFDILTLKKNFSWL